MGYSIQYGKEMIKIQHPSKMSYKSKFLVTCLLISCIIIVFLSLTGGIDCMKQYILPGDADVTKAALNTLVSNLKNGEPIDGAVTAFCQEIYANATFPQ